MTTILQSNANFIKSFPGISPKQTINGHNDSDITLLRKTLRDSWNGNNKINGYNRVITPFRNAYNAGDFLARERYSCGGSNQINLDSPGWKGMVRSIMQKCDNTNVPAAICNTKFVYDSSDYTKFKKQSAYINNYNDLSYVGYNNASYDATMRVRRW